MDKPTPLASEGLRRRGDPGGGGLVHTCTREAGSQLGFEVVRVVMSMARLSAGAGYRYLTRDTCCADAHRAAGTSLTSYYTALGYPPGTWRGDGLAGLGYDGAGRRVGRIRAGAVVTEEAMAAVYGAGRDPVTGDTARCPLPAVQDPHRADPGREPPAPRGLVRCPPGRRGQADRDTETARRMPVAVAGFDLTFTVPKSVSVPWAIADPRHAGGDRGRAPGRGRRRPGPGAVPGAVHPHRQGRLRPGHYAGDGRGRVRAPDTRAGDPNLHTHLVLANRVQAGDGRWRTVEIGSDVDLRVRGPR